MLPVFRFGDLQHIFRLYGNCGKKMNSSYVTAVWLHALWHTGHGVAQPQGQEHTCTGAIAPNVRMPGLVGKSGCSRQNWGKNWLRL